MSWGTNRLTAACGARARASQAVESRGPNEIRATRVAMRGCCTMAITTATFDCYGTLVDWEGGVAGFLYDLARRSGDEDPGAGRALRERWEELQFDEIQGDYRSYRDILRDSLAEWCGERGYHWNDNDAGALLRSMESWQPFPDTVPALRRAKEAGLRLAIVSNTDRAIMD